MANTIKVKRGTDANRASVTPAEGELLYTTDTKKVYVGDGSTAGGNEVGGGGSSQTPAELLADIKTVDGSGSGLDADLLDGQEGTYYAAASSLSNYLPLTGGTLTGNLIVDINGTAAGLVVNSNTGTNPNAATIDLIETNVNPPTFGSGSNGFRIAYNGDVNRLEAISYTLSGNEQRLRFAIDRSSGDASFYADDGTTQDFYWDASASSLGIGTTSPATALDVSGVITATGGNSTNWNTAYGWGDHSAAGYLASSSYTASDVLTKIKTVDGAGSGLDADLLDGQQGSYYAAASSLSNYLPLTGGTITGALKLNGGSYTSGIDTTTGAAVIDKGDYILSDDGNYLRRVIGHLTSGNIEIGQSGTSLINAINFLPGTAGNSAVRVNGNTVWNAGNDGSGSGLDADLLDGQHASAFQPAGTYNTIIGTDTDINTSGSTIIDNIFVTDGVITSMGTRTLTAADIGAITGNQTITLTGDVSGSGTTSIAVTVADDSHNHIISNVDGLQTALDGKLSTSGKAADSNLLDGIDSGSFLRSDAADTKTSGDLSFSSNVSVRFGTGIQSEIYSNGTHTYWDTATSGNDIYFRAGTGSRFLMDMGTGDFHADGDVIAASTSVSDRRLKDDITNIEGALDKVSQLNGVNYTWKKTGKADTGLIAQEVQAVLPNIVKEVTQLDGEECLAITYAGVIGLLVESVKELKAEVEALKDGTA